MGSVAMEALTTEVPSPQVSPETPHIAKTATAAYQPESKTSYTIKDVPIGTCRPIRVICMGAGYSGLTMGIIFSQAMKGRNAEFVIYERNRDLGGTWLENRYADIH